MYSRWFSLSVVAFWMVSMSWLIQGKVLPRLAVGDPPNYRAILKQHESHDEPVGWTIFLNDRPLGSTTSRRKILDNGVTEFRTAVRLDRLPVDEIPWVKTLLRPEAQLELSSFHLTADGTLSIDPLGRPLGFNSTLTFGEQRSGAGARAAVVRATAPVRVQLVVQGTIEGNQLKLKVRFGEFVYNTSTYLEPDALVSDALSPQAYLPGLKVGQTWSVPLYSPLRLPTSPELLQATVERVDPIVWCSQDVAALLVVFRGDPGGELTNARSVRARAWVGPDGQVLKSELPLSETRLTFERLPPGHPSFEP